MSKQYKRGVPITKEAVDVVVRKWDTHSTKEIAEMVGEIPQRVSYIATQLRQNGVKLVKKTGKRGFWKEISSNY